MTDTVHLPICNHCSHIEEDPETAPCGSCLCHQLHWEPNTLTKAAPDMLSLLKSAELDFARSRDTLELIKDLIKGIDDDS